MLYYEDSELWLLIGIIIQQQRWRSDYSVFKYNLLHNCIYFGMHYHYLLYFSGTTVIKYITGNYVAYCFAEVEGYSKFGSYTGNGSADGPFVYTGFRPAFVLFKRSDSTGNWYIFDVQRNTYNLTNLTLFPNLSGAESTETNNILDILSNGFKHRGIGGFSNASGGTYIYMAFASNPFKNSLAR